MTMYGMDPELVDQVARQLRSSAGELSHIIRALDSSVQQVNGAAWQGPDAQQFQDAWNAQRAALTNIQTQIEELATSAAQNAAQQRQASQS